MFQFHGIKYINLIYIYIYIYIDVCYVCCVRVCVYVCLSMYMCFVKKYMKNVWIKKKKVLSITFFENFSWVWKTLTHLPSDTF